MTCTLPRVLELFDYLKPVDFHQYYTNINTHEQNFINQIRNKNKTLSE